MTQTCYYQTFFRQNSRFTDKMPSPQSNWSHTDLPQTGRFVSTIVDNKVWFVKHGSNQINIYDPLTNNWSISLLNFSIYSSLPATTYKNAAINLNNKVYFTGSQTVSIYDILSQSWSSITLSEKKYFIPAAVSNGKIAFIGGMTSWFVYSALIEIYDPATNSWSIRYMSSDLFYESIISYNNYIYSAGGMINLENTILASICKFEL